MLLPTEIQSIIKTTVEGILEYCATQVSLVLDGTYTIKKKLMERYYYTRHSNKKPINKNLQKGVSYKKRIAGCSKYLPVDNLDLNITSDESLEDSIDWLVGESQKSDRDEERIKLLMETTFNSQREYVVKLVEKGDIAKMKIRWPILFEEHFFFEHFKTVCSKQFEAEDIFLKIANLWNHFDKDENVNNAVELFFKYF